MTSATVMDYYELLKVSRSASAEELGKTLRDQRHQWHMRQNSADPSLRAAAEARVAQLDEAEKILLDPAARARYDRELAAAPAPATAAGAADLSGGASWMDRTRELLESSDGRTAAYMAREATHSEPNNPEAWALRAQASLMNGDLRDAEVEVQQALRLDPDEVRYIAALGDVYAVAENWHRALAEFERASRLDPEDPYLRAGVGQALVNTEQSKKAVGIFEDLVDEHPDNEMFRYGLAVALQDSALEAMTLLRDGTRIVTSPAQADLAEEHARRIARLGLRDREILDAVAGLNTMVEEARQMRWIHTGTAKLYLTAFVVGGICPLFSGKAAGVLLGFAIAIGLVVIYTMRHRKPFWEHRRKMISGLVVRQGIA
jgi:curved DNA-binding protein CbpA